MGNPIDEARARSTATYDAAADSFDHPANSFWERFGSATVERLGLKSGQRVLDVCCGSGASALPAARLVGPTGQVVGVDLSQGLLELARKKAAVEGLRQAEFRTGDLLDLRFAAEQFDAVVCVFGIFFVPDMVAAARELWSAVRPGGKLAVTTWGPRFFEPASSAFWSAVRALRPDLDRGFNPWDRISEPAALRALLSEAGIDRVEVVAQPGHHAVPTAESWWTAVLGSGFRGTLEQLGVHERECVRAANLDFMRSARIDAVEANVVYAIASKRAAQ